MFCYVCVQNDSSVSLECWEYLEVVILQWNLYWQSSRRGMFVGGPRNAVCRSTCYMIYLLPWNITTTTVIIIITITNTMIILFGHINVASKQTINIEVNRTCKAQ